jgi:hypothetical protein
VAIVALVGEALSFKDMIPPSSPRPVKDLGWQLARPCQGRWLVSLGDAVLGERGRGTIEAQTQQSCHPQAANRSKKSVQREARVAASWSRVGKSVAGIPRKWSNLALVGVEKFSKTRQPKQKTHSADETQKSGKAPTRTTWWANGL